MDKGTKQRKIKIIMLNLIINKFRLETVRTFQDAMAIIIESSLLIQQIKIIQAIPKDRLNSGGVVMKANNLK